jgi:hypothetical protein
MSLWTSSVICLLVLLTVHSQAQPANSDSGPPAIEEFTGPSADLPRQLLFAKKDWDLNQAYSDVFKILSNQNACSSFYGGPRSATIVLNSFFSLVKSAPLLREVSFRMGGKLTLVRNPRARVFYRLFDKTMVNSDGAFYQRRDTMRKFPSNVGSFGPGTRPARALILLHELGHLIQGENGTWLIPDDGYNGPQSTANTLRIQQVCRAQLEQLK